MAPAGEPDDFTYVLIPADDDLPMREYTAKTAPFGDTLAELLKKDFAGGPLTNMDSLRAEYGDVVDAKIDGFQAAANAGTVEVMSLVRPSKTNLPQRMTGTYLYMDEMGSLKGKPPNRRALELAKRCGLDVEHPLPGDVYVGRVAIEPNMNSVSFTLNEMASASPWIQQAPSENASYSGALGKFSDAVREKRVDVKSAEEIEAENESRGWRWTQTEDELEVTITVPENTAARDVKVVVTNTSLRVALKSNPDDPVADIKRFFGAVRGEDSTWTIGKDEKGQHVQVTMEKVEATTWHRLEPKKV